MSINLPANADKGARDARYDILFEPVRIGPKLLRNRFFQVPHCIGAGTEKPGFQAYHRGMKAEGGWAAVCTEYCSIHPESDDTPLVGARLWDDDDVNNLAVMCDRAHHFGALAGVELWHGGCHPLSNETRQVAHGVSQLPSDIRSGHYARIADREDIHRLQQYYVDAAVRAQQAGFDIIYVYAASSELPMQFLSPYYNNRVDEYGGSLENRARFWLETLAKVREAVGGNCAIATRISVDTLQGSAGIEVKREGVRLIEMANDLVDLFDVLIGGSTGGESGQDSGSSRFFPENHQQEYTRWVKAGNHTDKPVVGVGRFTSPDTMVQVVRSGQYDLIGAARPSIADPFLPEKIREGRLDDIRECIGCNLCAARWEMGGAPIVCTQNATVGEEYRRGWHPERFTPARNRDKNVLVVGAGPAGMECAMVLGKRGMSAVHLLDAEVEIGGCVNWIAKLGHSDGKDNFFRGTARSLAEWRRLVDYRRIQLDKLPNVEIHTRTRVSTDQVRDYEADIVIIATGCRYATDGTNAVTHSPISGADATSSWQLTPYDVVKGSKPIGPHVLVFEGEDYFMGASIAQKLAGEGHTVTLVTPNQVIGQFMEYTREAPMMHRDLHRLRVRMMTSTMIERIEDHVVTTYSVWAPSETICHEVDTLVLCSARISNAELYSDLRADRTSLEAKGLEGLYVIGDAAAPRMIVDCIFDGHRLAREIDSDDPSVALPFIRERPVWGRSRSSHYPQVPLGRDVTSR